MTKSFHNMFGTTTMGARGQVVIPAQARKALGLKPTDQLLVMGGGQGKMLMLMKADQMGKVMAMIMEQVAKGPLGPEFIKQVRLLSEKGKIS